MKKLIILLILSLVFFFCFYLVRNSSTDPEQLFHVSMYEYEMGENVVVEAAVYANMQVRLKSKNKLLATSFFIEKETYNEIIKYWENNQRQKVIKLNLADSRSRRRDTLSLRAFIHICKAALEDRKSVV